MCEFIWCLDMKIHKVLIFGGNIECIYGIDWRYLFEQKKYQELLKHSWFISKIINEIEKLEDISIEVLEYWNNTIGENSIYGKGNPTTQLLLSKMNMMKNIEIQIGRAHV